MEGARTEVPETWILDFYTKGVLFAAPVPSGRQNQRLGEDRKILYTS